MPVFDFIAGFVKNFGWVVLWLTVFIRLVTSPLTYSSYLSSAKMKVLKPELDEIKKKLGDDQQGFAMEQIVNLGRDLYSFVRPINKYIIMPVFDFFAGFVQNYGWVVFY